MRALASHQCGPGSNPGVDAICGLSLLLVLSLAPRGFSPGSPIFFSPQKRTFPNSNSIWTHGHVSVSSHELLSVPWVNKLQLQITNSRGISGRLRDCTTSFLPENKIIAAKPCFSELESRSSRLETQSVIESRGSSRDCQLKACLQGEREGHPCARVTLASGLKLALVYKQTSQVGLPYHPGQLYQLYWRVSSCVTFFVTSKIGSSLWKIPHI